LLKYFSVLTVSFHEANALFGFFIMLVVVNQWVSGIPLALSLIPEPMIIPIVRDEEDIEDMYTDDFFWMHERGVDMLFLLCWMHLFRKIYVNAFEYEGESSWKTGVLTFLMLQAITFLGLVLCCTHLSEITLTIAANIVHTFFFFHGKIYWLIFTDKNLNADTLVRLAFAHYITGFYMGYLGLLHGMEMHYDWKNEYSTDNLDAEMIWYEEALANEVGSFVEIIVLFNIFCYLLYCEPEALSYEIFMWGDVGLVPDIRFYGVAPHWYFRPFMAWLIVCPHHKTGIFGLVYFFFVLYHQPTLQNNSEYGLFGFRKVASDVYGKNAVKIFKSFEKDVDKTLFFN